MSRVPSGVCCLVSSGLHCHATFLSSSSPAPASLAAGGAVPTRVERHVPPAARVVRPGARGPRDGSGRAGVLGADSGAPAEQPNPTPSAAADVTTGK